MNAHRSPEHQPAWPARPRFGEASRAAPGPQVDGKLVWLALAGGLCLATGMVGARAEPAYHSPTAIVPSPSGQTLFVACATARHIAILDASSRIVRQHIALDQSPTGLARSSDGTRLYVTCSAPASHVAVIDLRQFKVADRIQVGHTAMAPRLSPDEKTLYVCNRFDDDVSVIDLNTGRETRRIKVSREPVAAAVTPDGQFLLVANHIYDPVADGPGIAAVVSVIDTTRFQVVKQIKLARGSGLLRSIAVSPDGKFAAVSHLVARYYLPTTEVDFGRINSNALSFLDLERMDYLRIVFLDQARRGAANPWDVAWTTDGKQIVVSLAGTHEICLIEAPERPQKPVSAGERIALPGYGPRAFALLGSRVYVANYFSDSLATVDLEAHYREAENIPLAPSQPLTAARRGELLFNDAKICFQEWQSCASCHDIDGRMDGLNWDLLNDGLGNPKNAKSLLWAHQTPPVMSLGVRSTAEIAVRAGLRHILFTTQPEEVPTAIDAYLKSLQPVPSPHLVNGALSAAAQRGRDIFFQAEAGCADCHTPPLYTGLNGFDVGTRGKYDRPEDPDSFDTPALVELWRTAPYLHDGSASTLRQVLTTRNRGDLHGKTSHLSPEQLSDLEAYLLSL